MEAQFKADEIGVPMCVAVADASGQLIAFERMAGDKLTSAIIAQDKAYTAADAKRTREIYNLVSREVSTGMQVRLFVRMIRWDRSGDELMRRKSATS